MAIYYIVVHREVIGAAIIVVSGAILLYIYIRLLVGPTWLRGAQERGGATLLRQRVTYLVINFSVGAIWVACL